MGAPLTGWPHRWSAALAALSVAACGLDTGGLADDDGGADQSFDASPDVTGSDAAGDAMIRPDAMADASMPRDATADSLPADASPDASPCADTPTSCGPPGVCVDCTGSSRGGACVGGACGCNAPSECPSLNACQTNHTCSSACGTGPSLACNGGCCNAGTCATVGDTTCGDFGAACVDCTTTTAGAKCELTGLGYACGCDGPGSSNQCPMGRACFNKQCSTSCDGQHPCNGGCCSGNNIATSTCVANCFSGTCQQHYCQ